MTSRKVKKAEQLSDKEGAAGDKKKKSRKFSSTDSLSVQSDPSRVIIYTCYDAQNNLSQLKFEGEAYAVPRLVLQVIGMIITYHPNINSVNFNGGMAGYTLLELRAMQAKLTNLTDICLDNSFIPEANFEVILEDTTQTKYLSLSRCCINDDVVQKIFANLAAGQASKTLSTLNLASNRISDAGAKYIADALRSNRQLNYLNLSANQITDDGVLLILDKLKMFPLTTEEIQLKRKAHIQFLFEREANRKVTKIDNEAVRRISKQSIKKSARATSKQAKTEEDAEDEFEHVYSSKNINTIGDTNYCLGNNSLCAFNVAHNNLSLITLRKLIEILEYQRRVDRRPRGLLRINVEGNFLPETCKEYDQLNELIDDQIKATLKDTQKKIGSVASTPRKKTIK